MGFINVQIMSNNVLKSKNFTVIKHNMFKIHTVLKKKYKCRYHDNEPTFLAVLLYQAFSPDMKMA